MSSARFEGSFLGDVERLAPTSRLECKICWWVYDPTVGDEYRQIPPQTPFSQLPDDWRCPQCDGEREQFMRLDDGPVSVAAEQRSAPTPPKVAAPPPKAAVVPLLSPEEQQTVAVAAKLKSVFSDIHRHQMRAMPMVNPALGVSTVAFQPWQGQVVGVLITPWFMNLVLLPALEAPEAEATTRVGSVKAVDFPSGRYEFIVNQRPELGSYMACSLFSPMDEFTSQAQAEAVAAAVMTALFDPQYCDEGGGKAERG